MSREFKPDTFMPHLKIRYKAVIEGQAPGIRF